MNATPNPVATAAPLNFTVQGGTLQEVVTVLEDSLNVLDVIPATAPFAGLATILLGIITAAITRVKTETGKPIDLSKIPIEAPLP